jgi:hypothetical protein
MIAAVAVDADSAERIGISLCKKGHDERDMSRDADHGMGRIGVALAGPIAGMRVHVGDDV